MRKMRRTSAVIKAVLEVMVTEYVCIHESRSAMRMPARRVHIGHTSVEQVRDHRATSHWHELSSSRTDLLANSALRFMTTP